MEVDDIIYKLGEFMTTKEMFCFSRVSPQWKTNLDFHKKRKCLQMYDEVKMVHFCSNMCPCSLESIFEQYMTDFFLKRNICRIIENKSVPDWFMNIIKKRKNQPICEKKN